MQKQNIVIIILSLTVICLLIWPFGGRSSDSEQLKKQLANSISRSTEIENTAKRLQESNSDLVGELEKERNISAELRERNKELERINQGFEQNNREQRELVNGITAGDIGIDETIERIESGLKRCSENVKELESQE